MKNYFNIILISSILLLIFPFLAMPELLENIYVLLFAFVIAYTSLLLRHKIDISIDDDEEISLQDYVKELKERFKKQNEIYQPTTKEKRISDISIDEK
jgi:hypothetical protein